MCLLVLMKGSRFDLSTHLTTERWGYSCLWTLHVNLPVPIWSPSLWRKPPKSPLSKRKRVILVPLRREIWFKEREWSQKETALCAWASLLKYLPLTISIDTWMRVGSAKVEMWKSICWYFNPRPQLETKAPHENKPCRNQCRRCTPVL